MSTRRKVLCAFALLMIVAGIVIAHIWFGLFSSPEYYKGLDWNTNKKQLFYRHIQGTEHTVFCYVFKVSLLCSRRCNADKKTPSGWERIRLAGKMGAV